MSTENKYQFKGTPEEWEFDERFIQAYDVNDKQIKICEVYHPIHDIGYHSPIKAEANAHLIAAAPELLQACLRVYEITKECDLWETIGEEEDGYLVQAIHKALNIQD